ncbi:phosphoadenosine phosphosulfate reductase [Aliiroseovarius subalbicans]|uniref:phosphoadenosine phosphosulfate reductase n=1 Tax=Aliiroseovarius subalbicans TaxID=2925840 RepID=UPI001F561605|nr:phosphoadenosine phosphosulfate reductase [Aliiroseovarius subalbicans]MCI2398854.1 phosphoadenosine phosphosulfate reductase [Aliiroseovarius subalbicans]
MQEDVLTVPVDLAEASRADWLAQIEDMGEERGYFEPLGKRHAAILTDEGPTLIVTFETIDAIRTGSESHEPMGWELVAEDGWSNLCLLAHDDSWFRDKSVYGYFDRLVDDGFFEDFDRVVFYGTGMCGYAAAAYSVVAPGATVIALQPQATLDPALTEWDTRFPAMRRTSFTDRYGYAPDMIEAAEGAFIIYDPTVPVDAMHAALFKRSNVTRLRCPNLGHTLEADLWQMGALPDMIGAAAQGNLDAPMFHRLYRQRRTHMPYLRTLLERMQNANRPRMVQMLSNSVVARMNAPRFRRARELAEQQLEGTPSETTPIL